MDAVRTSVLSTRWRSLWQWVPGFDLDSLEFSNVDAFVSFADRLFDSDKVSSIRKVRLRLIEAGPNLNLYLRSWIDDLTRIQQLDLHFVLIRGDNVIPQNTYTCKTLVHLRLSCLSRLNPESVSLPCLKILHLESIGHLSEATLEKLISGSPVLEDLTIFRCFHDGEVVLPVRSQTLKRINISAFTNVVVDAPLLQFLRTSVSTTKNYTIINSSFPLKLDIDALNIRAVYSKSMIGDILTDMKRVGDLAINSEMWKAICVYLKSRPLCHFRQLFRLSARFCKSDLQMLPTLLESCPELKSLVLELVEDSFMRGKKKIEPKVMFATVPRCLVSSLRFVEMKGSISGYEGEMELIRYFLKNSTILEKLKLHLYYTTAKEKFAFLTELVAMPRCCSACEVIVR